MLSAESAAGKFPVGISRADRGLIEDVATDPSDGKRRPVSAVGITWRERLAGRAIICGENSYCPRPSLACQA